VRRGGQDSPPSGALLHHGPRLVYQPPWEADGWKPASTPTTSWPNPLHDPNAAPPVTLDEPPAVHARSASPFHGRTSRLARPSNLRYDLRGRGADLRSTSPSTDRERPRVRARRPQPALTASITGRSIGPCPRPRPTNLNAPLNDTTHGPRLWTEEGCGLAGGKKPFPLGWLAASTATTSATTTRSLLGERVVPGPVPEFPPRDWRAPKDVLLFFPPTSHYKLNQFRNSSGEGTPGPSGDRFRPHRRPSANLRPSNEDREQVFDGIFGKRQQRHFPLRLRTPGSHERGNGGGARAFIAKPYKGLGPAPRPERPGPPGGVRLGRDQRTRSNVPLLHRPRTFVICGRPKGHLEGRKRVELRGWAAKSRIMRGP